MPGGRNRALSTTSDSLPAVDYATVTATRASSSLMRTPPPIRAGDAAGTDQPIGAAWTATSASQDWRHTGGLPVTRQSSGPVQSALGKLIMIREGQARLRSSRNHLNAPEQTSISPTRLR